MLTSEDKLEPRSESRSSDSSDAVDAPFGAPSLGPLGIGMEFHHIGVAVKSIRKALEYYVGAFGFRKATEVLDVPSQRVRVCFVTSPAGVLIELVEGVGDDSPVADIVSRPGAGPYHLCYAVPDLDRAIERLRGERCFLLQHFDRRAYGHSRFAFLLTPDRQLFELCETDTGSADGRALAQPRRYTFKTLFFEATRLCNLACPMCMASSNDTEIVKASVARELSIDEVERHILATARDIGVETITWSGGEYLLRTGAVELVRRATAHGYYSTVCTNALRLSRDDLIALKEASAGTVVMAVGINSIEDESSWTRDADCNVALRALETCKELEIKRHVVVNVGRHNENSLERTLQWLEDQNIPYNRSPYTARGSGREYWDDLRITRESMEAKIHPELRKHANGYVSYTPFFLSPELHERYSKGERNVTVPQNPSIGCWCGTWLAVNAEGDVSPCGILLDELKCGNVREKTLQQIVDESPAFQQVLDRNLLEGKCGRCRYKLTCGGCRAMAYFEHGDLMAEDPTCFFEPVDETTISPHEEQTNKMFRLYAFMARHANPGRLRARKT
jgi:radical SAM protein with 4Fe4S-binding SPASM domain